MWMVSTKPRLTPKPVVVDMLLVLVGGSGCDLGVTTITHQPQFFQLNLWQSSMWVVSRTLLFSFLFSLNRLTLQTCWLTCSLFLLVAVAMTLGSPGLPISPNFPNQTYGKAPCGWSQENYIKQQQQNRLADKPVGWHVSCSCWWQWPWPWGHQDYPSAPIFPIKLTATLHVDSLKKTI